MPFVEEHSNFNTWKIPGFVIGPGGNGESWKNPISKYCARVRQWENTKSGLFWNTLYYNTFAVTTPEFVGQVESITQEVVDAEAKAMSSLASGPGTWISSDDLEHLGRYGIGSGFRQLCYTTNALQLRVLHKMGERYVKDRDAVIQRAQLDTFHRPFGKWHQASYASRLCNNLKTLASYGISKETIANHPTGNHRNNFQKIARDVVVHKMVRYSCEERIRRKIKRWKFTDPPAHVTNRIMNNIDVMKKAVPPAVRASYFRALWNGIPTSRRMASMKGYIVRNCVLNCSDTAADSIEHYCHCPELRSLLEVGCGSTWLHQLESIDDFSGSPRA